MISSPVCRGGAYPKGTGSTSRSYLAVCRWRCSARAPAVWGKRAEQSPAPTNIIVPLRNHRCRFFHPLLSKAGHAGPALRRAGPFPACCRDTGRRGRRPLRRAGRLLCHQRRLPSNPPPGKAAHAGAALRRNRAHPQPTNPFNDCYRDTARRGRRALRITGAGPSTDGAPLRCKSAARTSHRMAAR